MTVKKMKRHCSDNKYLHRDFHVSCDMGIAYVGRRYGEEGVREYLTQFAENCLGFLCDDIRERGLYAIERYLLQLYATEEADGALHIEKNRDCLNVAIDYSPAVRYMKWVGHNPSEWYVYATSAVFEAVAKKTGLIFEMLTYSADTGAANYRFSKREEG